MTAGLARVPLIELRDVSFAYDGIPAVRDVSLRVEQGDFLGLIGPNGSGKTTLLKLMVGLLRPQRGEVRLYGRPLAVAGPLRRRVAYVPQLTGRFERHFPATVAEVVAMGRTLRRPLAARLDAADRRAVARALELTGLSHLRDRAVAELSGGQQQRVLIARALAQEPEALLLDEPTSGVDLATQERFYHLLRDLNRDHGLTIVLVSHDVLAITAHINRLACINQRLHYHGDPAEFLSRGDLHELYGHVHVIGGHAHD